MAELTEADLEAAARAAYAETVKRAYKHYSDPEVLARYKPWDEVSESWREDYTAVIATAIAAYEAAVGQGQINDRP